MKHNNNIEKKTELTQIEKQLDELNQVKVPGAKDTDIYQSMQAKLQKRGSSLAL